MAYKENVIALLNSQELSKEQKEKLEKIFPELNESEDERTKNEIIAFVEQSIHRGGGTPIPEEQENKWISWLEKQGEKKHKFIIGDIISNNNTTFRVDNIVKNCMGKDCYFLVNVKSEKDGTRYLKFTDSQGRTHNSGEITWLCEQVDAQFEKQREEEKELKKVEQKPLQWNISDYRTWQYIVSDVLTKHDGIGQYLDDGFCKNIAKYMQETWGKRLHLD